SQQFEIQPLLCAEILMRLRIIHADAEYHGSGLFILRQIALEVASLNGTARREILRVKIEHHPFASIILETDILALIVLEREIGGRFAYFGERAICGANGGGDQH